MSPGESIFTPSYSITVTMLWLFRFVLGDWLGKKLKMETPPLLAGNCGVIDGVYRPTISSHLSPDISDKSEQHLILRCHDHC